jgi:predicted RNA-binding Zn-ribbon protein involved in translation (DUF1610 family)
MSALESIPFACPGCGRRYKIVLIDPSPYDSRNAAIKCVQCGVVLRPTKGSAFLPPHIATLWQLLASYTTSKARTTH